MASRIFSLEFCDGGTLTEQLKKKRPSPREAAELIETLARAMHYAHLRGVVHRDLKPAQRVARRLTSTPKITDFGLAKRIDDEARDVSKSGAIMGTASYMAPEQAAGKVRDTGPAADVYALGALLYECLTGRPPFDGPQHIVLVSVLNDEPVPPSRFSAEGAARPGDDLPEVSERRSRTGAMPARRRWPTICVVSRRASRCRRGPTGRLERAVKWAKRRPALAALLCVIVLALASLVTIGIWFTWKLDRHGATLRKEARNGRHRGPRLPGEHLSTFRRPTAGGQHDGPSDPGRCREAHSAGVCGSTGAARRAAGGHRDVKRGIDRTAPLAMILEVRGTVQLQSTRRREATRRFRRRCSMPTTA